MLDAAQVSFSEMGGMDLAQLGRHLPLVDCHFDQKGKGRTPLAHMLPADCGNNGHPNSNICRRMGFSGQTFPSQATPSSSHGNRNMIAEPLFCKAAGGLQSSHICQCLLSFRHDFPTIFSSLAGWVDWWWWALVTWSMFVMLQKGPR